MLEVLSSARGTAVGLSEVPDPVFAQGMVGPGTAVVPASGRQDALSPIAGTIVKLHAHAFVVLGSQDRGVLVHLGIDTVKLNGEGFETLVAEGEHVEAGHPLIRWDPAQVVEKGLSPIVPVVALDAVGDVISAAVSGEVAAGDPLFQWA